MISHWLKLNDTVDPSWWRPLEGLAARVAEQPELPPVDPDDFLYAARIVRENAPVLHIYRHLLTRRYVLVDECGGVWRFERGRGYVPVNRLADALQAAELDRAEVLARRTRRGPRRRVGAGDPSGPGQPVSTGAEPGGQATDEDGTDDVIGEELAGDPAPVAV